MRFVLGAALLALALPSAARAADATVGFEPTGGAQAWTVPTGVTTATFDLYGAAGQSGFVSENAVAAGGRGAHVRATLSVVPGQVIEIMVGTRPANGGRFGGFNGGGAPVASSRASGAEEEAPPTSAWARAPSISLAHSPPARSLPVAAGAAVARASASFPARASHGSEETAAVPASRA